MAKVTRTPHGVSDFSTLYQACVTLGDPDATVTINGFASIESDVLTVQQMNDALDMSENGELFSNKSAKIAAVSARSDALQAEGVDCWESWL